ncbi:putative sensory transduction system regulatory protein [Candidatus Competibacter denitrificans Run_A_D11]|uniref:Sensory transduction system regulatory protein n=1 Tax=Candidatus Competibacter denitrificans Run_A_D11 TaxID=1400863 RepID=W6MEF4_9GAMM|nr:HD domain-containing phosphohydrolase [Candidatus Competibacter denitrificans]CDI04518.1 putative sensory transduction system regulatory protein [Candidatus Competibacter denitrificans Run_A_D11]HAS87168.1 HD domain-containing protein [Candidatus Competibacteraceae bacterium]
MLSYKSLTLSLIAVSAVLMIYNILKYRSIYLLTNNLLEKKEPLLNKASRVHHLLICFFCIGYFVIFFLLLNDRSIMSDLLVAIIFLFGSIFVFLDITLQIKLFSSIQKKHQSIIERNEQLNKTEDAAIFTLAYLAEIKHPETSHHIERTSNYVSLLARELQKLPEYKGYLTERYIKDIVKSAPLHDIGKIRVPDSILSKPGKLTSEEFEIIKLHCEYGADILRTAEKKLGFQSFLRIAIQITFSHHEKWNGEGYPRGLKGNKIPLSARIMAVADVYDALRTESYYKKKVSHEICCRVFMKEQGIHFDPDIVDAFFRCEKAFAEISEAYYERQDDPQLKSQNSTIPIKPAFEQSNSRLAP